METKKKRGFWASLFTPKPCKCTAQIDKLIAENQPKEQPENENNQSKPDSNPKPDNTQTSKCSCGGNC